MICIPIRSPIGRSSCLAVPLTSSVKEPKRQMTQKPLSRSSMPRSGGSRWKTRLSTRARANSSTQRKEILDREHPLPMVRQYELLDLPGSTSYHAPTLISDEELALMALIEGCHLKYSFYGSRWIRDWLADEGYQIIRKRVQRLMVTMVIVALYPRRNLSLANQAHKIYPYLLRNLVIDRPNQVWAMDITYIPMARGFVCLVAVIDGQSRKILSRRLSNMLDARFYVNALEEAFTTDGKPEIFNTDQGSQFTG